MTTDINVKQNIVAVSGVISASGPAVLQNINGENWETDDSDDDVVCYFQIFDQIAEPSNGDTPLFSWRIPPGAQFNANMPGPSINEVIGQHFATGISVGWSSTNDTFTAAGNGGKWWATGRSLL